MGGQDDRHWRQLQRERQQHRGDIQAGDTDQPHLIHPANEGHDAERTRARLQDWADEEGGRGRDARALERLEREEAGGGAPEQPPSTAAKPAEPAEQARHGGHLRGGEPHKHPRPAASTMHDPGLGPHALRPDDARLKQLEAEEEEE